MTSRGFVEAASFNEAAVRRPRIVSDAYEAGHVLYELQ